MTQIGDFIWEETLQALIVKTTGNAEDIKLAQIMQANKWMATDILLYQASYEHLYGLQDTGMYIHYVSIK